MQLYCYLSVVINNNNKNYDQICTLFGLSVTKISQCDPGQGSARDWHFFLLLTVQTFTEFLESNLAV